MNAPPQVDPIETLTQYHSYVADLSALMARDPEPQSPEGLWLLALVDAIEVFERQEWPTMFAQFNAPDDPSALSGE